MAAFQYRPEMLERIGVHQKIAGGGEPKRTRRDGTGELSQLVNSHGAFQAHRTGPVEMAASSAKEIGRLPCGAGQRL